MSDQRDRVGLSAFVTVALVVFALCLLGTTVVDLIGGRDLGDAVPGNVPGSVGSGVGAVVVLWLVGRIQR